MKICYIASAQSHYHPKWFEYFTQRGYEIHLISVDRPPSQIPNVTIHCFPQFKLRMLRLAFTLLFGGIFTKRIIKKIKPDILHAVEVDEGLCGALSGFHPFIMTPNGSDLLVYANKYAFVRWMFKYIFCRADAVTSDSILLQNASATLGAVKDKNYIIQWGVDLNQFNPQVDGSSIRERHDLGASPLILSSRALTTNYNIDIILRCIPEVLKEAPSAKFMFVYGFSDKGVEMKRLAADLGVDDSTIFAGPVDYQEMPYYIAAADVCVSVPSSDSSPRAVYEAMACGVPPVISDLHWTKDFIIPEQNALLVPVKDHRKLAAAILRLLTDKELRKKIKEANLKLVDEKLNYHKHMAKMESIYQSLCRVKRGNRKYSLIRVRKLKLADVNCELFSNSSWIGFAGVHGIILRFSLRLSILINHTNYIKRAVLKYLPRFLTICALVAVNEQDEIIGYAFLATEQRLVKGLSTVLGIGLKSEYHNKGIGTKLFEELILLARKNRIAKIKLRVSTKNANAIHLYTKFGFKTMKEVAERKWYARTDYPVLKMEPNLDERG